MYSQVLVAVAHSKQIGQPLEVARRLASLLEADLKVLGSSFEEVVREIEMAPGSLIVVGSHGRRRLSGVIADLVDKLLERIDQPILLVGPSVEISSDWPVGPLLICSDGTSFSEGIVWSGAKLAKSLGLEPRFLSVTDGAPIPGCIDATRNGHSIDSLAGMAASIVGQKVHYDLVHGTDPGRAVVEQACWQRAALVALTTHGRSGLARLAHGSVAMAIGAKAPCPVLIRTSTVDHP